MDKQVDFRRKYRKFTRQLLAPFYAAWVLTSCLCFVILEPLVPMNIRTEFLFVLKTVDTKVGIYHV